MEKLLSEQVRVLRVWLDPKLKWQAYARVAQQKGLAALGAFQRVVVFTPEARLLQEPGCFITRQSGQ
jgi:hypothetical protein